MDIAPALLEKVQKEFNRLLSGNKEIKKYNELIKDGEATYEEMNDLAVTIGELMAKSYKTITAEDLPDGVMYYNIADRVVRPTLEAAQELVLEQSALTQKALNTKAGLGLNAVKGEVNRRRVQGVIDKLTAEPFENVRWILSEPVVNMLQSNVDDTIRANVEFHAKAGLRPVIKRTYNPVPITTYIKRGKHGKIYGPYPQTNPMPCKFCMSLAGTYDYDTVSREVYRRHENCRCKVLYDPRNGKVQDVHTKTWQEENQDAIRRRIEQIETILNEQ